MLYNLLIKSYLNLNWPFKYDCVIAHLYFINVVNYSDYFWMFDQNLIPGIQKKSSTKRVHLLFYNSEFDLMSVQEFDTYVPQKITLPCKPLVSYC